MEKTVIFDMDGVIFDTERLYMDCGKRVGDKYGLAGIEEVIRQCIGVTARQTKQIVCRALGEDVDCERFLSEISVLFHKRTQEQGIPVKPGAKELLCYLKENGYAVGLASSTRKARVEEELGQAGLLPFFQTVIGGDMVKRGKPDPEIYLRACEEMGVVPERTYAIEDSFNGVRSAWSAGMYVIMVPDLLAPDGEMQRLASAIYPSLSEVLEYFQGL